MKSIIEKFSTIKNNHSISLTWGLLSGGTFFLIYLIFTLLLIFNFRKWTLGNEREEIFDFQSQLVSNLKFETDELNAQNIEKHISSLPNSEGLQRIDQTTDQIDDETYHLKIVSIYRQGYVVNIYNPDMDEVFSSQSNNYKADKYRINEIREISEGNRLEALSRLVPVYSAYDSDVLIGYVLVVNTLNNYKMMMDQILRLTFILVIVALFVSFGAGFLLSNSFLRPINRLTFAMEEIQKNPESEMRLYEGDKTTEIDKLAVTYNEMVDLMQRNIQNQRRFVEDVSHELRTPISVIEGYLNMLNRWGKSDPEILEESITVSLQELQRVKGMVQEMLSLSRAEQIMDYFSPEETQLESILKQTIANFEMLFPDFTFTLDIDSLDPIYGKISKEHFEQVIIILLENAVKYSEDRLEIHVSLSKDINDATLVIQDFGIGIGEEDRMNIFNRFYRVDKARSRASGGTGLGLPIAKQIIEGYGGTIQVDSVLDYGTIFRIKIPVVNK